MVFGNCHLVVVDDNDELVIELPGVIQAFKGNAAAQRTVADECNNIEVLRLLALARPKARLIEGEVWPA